MTVNYNNNMQQYYPRFYGNNSGQFQNAPNIIQKPIEKVETVINDTVDTFVKPPEQEEKKKSHKTAIATASAVLVITGLGALLNPRFSGKFINKLKTLSHEAEAKVQTNKNSFLKTKFYKTLIKTVNKITPIAQFINTANASKDVGFKWLCSADKFDKVKNPTLKKILKKINGGFTKVMTSINNTITNWFDNIGKATVLRNHKKVNKDLESLEDVIKVYRKKLSPTEQKALDAKLNEIRETRKFFSEKAVSKRLAHQEVLMKDLEHDFNNKLINDYIKKFKGFKSAGSFKDKSKDNYQLIKNNLSYWAEDIMMPTRNKLEKESKTVVNKLIGNDKGVKGQYQEVLDILSPHLKKEEKSIIEEGIKNSSKKLRHAQHSEYLEYFDKKRDLMLGGAPTDLLTNSAILAASGIAISNADTKEDRVSRALTLGFPAIAGIGTSLAMTAMLYSGVQGMAIGSAASGIISAIGSAADKIINPKTAPDLKNNEKQQNPDTVKPSDINKPPEVFYA